MGAKSLGGPINLHFADKASFARFILNSGRFIPLWTRFIIKWVTAGTA